MEGPGANNNDFEVLQRLTRLETKMDMIISVKDTAFEALQSTRSAHKRIDDVDKVLDPLPNIVMVTKEKVDRHDNYLFWATTSGMLGFVGLLLSIYGLLTK